MTQIEQWLREEGREQGRAEGRAEGREEGRLETARNALTKGLSAEDVAEITGLSLETVRRLKTEFLI
ncbi:Lambda repressor-like, DNA-binding domain protein [Acididesulfobacillus acetoxydans]|uniref:Lambda repressor-like, DNA-binding domain protein n=1 Tax=Acididesulfobacillus acetoxydans TaxID=1561005 RepID=A0A8S0WGC6_9FIRM|nr:hypothetical protein [Acididesulfobacillus acetoxydans]CAA7601772.1 Lambda repressor-like, DNA-binding domain protein [Acididesulfobacillus acetoxydans]CEJ09192.1 Hypothetical protein DEACI_3675 [Acididesulfobacillus acetoxydans]